MKIAIICYKGFGADGISAFIMNNYRFFDHTKILCSIIFPRIIGDENFAEKCLSEIRFNGDSYFHISKSDGVLKYFFTLVKYLSSQQFDAVHVHGSSASILMETLAAKIAGIKKIIAHSHNTTGNHVLIHRICRLLLNRIISVPLACGQEAGLWMYGKNVKFQVIPNGIETSKYQFDYAKRMSSRKALNIDKQLVIGHVGGFNEQKNQMFLIDIVRSAINEKLNVSLILIGRGHMLDSIKKYAIQQGVADSVLFLGQRSDVNELMMAMDVFFLPSLFEGFPIVGIEAQASGLPTFMADTIARETEITDLVEWLPIDDGPKCWINALKKIELRKNRPMYADVVAKQNYDVKTSSVLLQNIYLEG